MAAKNAISVKLEKEPLLLAAFLKCGVSAKKARRVSTTHVTYLFNVPHFQTVFEVGYWFAKFNR